MGALQRLLENPKTRGLDLDDPRTTALRREIVREKGFLSKLYRDWYGRIAAALPEGPGAVLELGSGGGFLDEFIPGLITSEVFPVPGLATCLDAFSLPFRADALRAIVMVDVLHHLPRPRDFFREASRCIRPGGRIILIEPWVSAWSTRIYQGLHHEPFLPDAQEWGFPATGPLSGANGALPWILFQRDRKTFEAEFPEWTIDRIQPLMPLAYLLSGGVSMRSLVPGWGYQPVRWFEQMLQPWMRFLAMFAHVVLVKEPAR